MIQEEVKQEGFSISRDNDPNAKTTIVKPGIITRINKWFDRMHPFLQLLILLMIVSTQMVFTEISGPIGYVYWAVLMLFVAGFRMIYLFKN